MCSEWGLLTLARRTYSSKCPPDILRCGLIASPAPKVRSRPAGHIFVVISALPAALQRRGPPKVRSRPAGHTQVVSK